MPSYRTPNVPPRPRHNDYKPRNAFELPRPAKLVTVKRHGSDSSGSSLEFQPEPCGRTKVRGFGHGAPRQRSRNLSRGPCTPVSASRPTAAASCDAPSERGDLARDASPSTNSTDEDVFEDALSSPVDTPSSDAPSCSASATEDDPANRTVEPGATDVPPIPSPSDPDTEAQTGRSQCQEPAPEAPLPLLSSSISRASLNTPNQEKHDEQHSQYAKIHQRPLPVPPRRPPRPLPDPHEYARPPSNTAQSSPANLADLSTDLPTRTELQQQGAAAAAAAHTPSTPSIERAVESSTSNPSRRDGMTTRRGSLRIDSRSAQNRASQDKDHDSETKPLGPPLTPFPRSPPPYHNASTEGEGSSRSRTRRHPVGRAARAKRVGGEGARRTVTIDVPDRSGPKPEVVLDAKHDVESSLTCFSGTSKLKSSRSRVTAAGTAESKAQDDGMVRRHARRTRSFRELVMPCIPRVHETFE